MDVFDALLHTTDPVVPEPIDHVYLDMIADDPLFNTDAVDDAAVEAAGEHLGQQEEEDIWRRCLNVAVRQHVQRRVRPSVDGSSGRTGTSRSLTN